MKLLSSAVLLATTLQLLTARLTSPLSNTVYSPSVTALLTVKARFDSDTLNCVMTGYGIGPCNRPPPADDHWR